MFKQLFCKNFILPKSIFLYHSVKLASIFLKTKRGVFILKMPSFIYILIIKIVILI